MSDVLRPDDLTPAYVEEVTARAWTIAQTIARAYEPAYNSGVPFTDLPSVTLSADDALTLAQFVGVTVCLFSGEL